MTAPFEADLDPQTGAPRIRFNFGNSWSVSLVLAMPDKSDTRFLLGSIAVCPTGQWGTGQTELRHNEATADELASILDEVSLLPRPESSAL